MLATPVNAMKLGYLQRGADETEMELSVSAIMKSGVAKTQICSLSDGDDWNALRIFLETTNSGDTVVINSLFDFCSSIKDLFRFWSLSAQYDINIESACESWFNTSKSEIDITHLERFYFDCITISTKRGLNIARSKGTKIGRRTGSGAIPDSILRQAYDRYLGSKSAVRDSCSAFGISETTLYRYMRKHSLSKRILR